LPAARSRGRIEIDIAGARIRVESGVDHATLAMVLAAVRGRTSQGSCFSAVVYLSGLVETIRAVGSHLSV
jgi:hypothetical protein